MSAATERQAVLLDTPRQLFAEWFGLLFPAAVFLLHLEAAYSLVPWVCAHDSVWMLRALSAVAVVLSGFGTWFAWRLRAALASHTASLTTVSLGRARFLALSGALLGSMFTLVLLCQLAAEFILSPCQ